MRTLPRPAQAYVVGVVLIGMVWFGISLRAANFDRLPLFIGLLIASMVSAARFKVRLPMMTNLSTMSGSCAADFASLLLLGPPLTMLVTAAGAWSQSTFHTRSANPLYRKLFNIASLGITIQAAGLAYRLAGGSFGHLSWPDAATPLLAATLVYFVVNTGTVAIAVALTTGQSTVRVWLHDFTWGAPSYFMAAGAAVVVAVVVERSLYGFLPLAMAPIYLTYRGYQTYAGRLEDERRHREVIESLNEGMFVLRYDGSVELWNDALERITGINRQEVLNHQLCDAVPGFLQTSVPDAVRDTLQGGAPAILQHVEFQAGDTTRVLYVRLLPFTTGVTGFVGDITDRTLAEEALRRSEERYALALAGANDGIWDWDLVHDIMYVSLRWKAMLGFAPDELTANADEWFGRVHPDDIGPLKTAIAAHRADQSGHFEHEHRVCHHDGEYRWMLCRGVAVTNAEGGAVRMAGSLTDVTERHVIQDQLRHAALHDTLTGLPNRALFMELLEQALARSKRSGDRLFGALFVDVDRFKVVNDSLGHLIGDQLLIEITRRLHACLRRGDVIARLGGDEFTILLNELRNPAEAIQIASRIQESFAVPFQLDEHEVFVTASIGLALSSTGYTNAEDILRDADTAMYRAKALGSNRQELFDVSMQPRAMDRLNMENEIRTGVERGEFHLCYQPIVALASQQLVGFEALLRWTRRDGRTIMPDEFIPLAEETGLIDIVGIWTLREACRQLGAWDERFPVMSERGMMVNVSTRQLMHPAFIEHVAAAIRDAGIEPDRLRLEITETALMHSPDAAATVLGELRALGVQVYLDDFGTGYSSLSYLHRFPVNTLKIDRSFVRSLADKREQPAIIESIVALARSVGANVIAEGVETQDQAKQLRQMGCGYAQGFFFSRPLAPVAAEAFLARSARSHAELVGRLSPPSVANVH
jgi:diguanylate cyclase (GGDEF)-like protein/PAS domain S-box-containing protein